MLIPVGWDYETELITDARKVPPPVCMSLAVHREHAALLAKSLVDAGVDEVKEGRKAYSDEEYVWFLVKGRGMELATKALVASPEYRLIAQNAAFDAAEAATIVGVGPVMAKYKQGLIRCTKIREGLICLSLGQLSFRIDVFEKKLKPTRMSLADHAAKYLGLDIREGKDLDSWRGNYASLKDVPLSEWPLGAITYAGMDAVHVLRVYIEQERSAPWEVDELPLKLQKVDGVYFADEVDQTIVDFAFLLPSAWGLRSEEAMVENVIAGWQVLAKEGDRIGREAGFIRTCFSKRDPTRRTKQDGTKDTKALAALVVEDCENRGVDVHYTDTGKVSVKAAVLKSCQNPVLKDYAATLQAARWAKDYGPFLRRAYMMPLTYSVRSLVSTGRISISKPQLQQSPRSEEFRNCFIPRPGYY